jgi:PIN domain nuclease of toxin-antitoxin system
MILLDTHAWVWWRNGDARMTAARIQWLDSQSVGEIGVSAISVWEVCKLVEVGKLLLPTDLGEWVSRSLADPSTRLVPLTPEIAIESTRLPAGFHRDPMDQILVATARLNRCPLMTADGRILAYPHVQSQAV